MGRNKNKQNKNKQNKPKQERRQKRRGKRKFNDLEWQSELFKLRQQLRAFGLTIREISGDGNCLFRAISDQLTGSESGHMDFRQMAVQFMLANRPDFEPFVEDDVSFDSYIEGMCQSSTWGGNMELQALSVVLEVNIRIHILGSPIWEIVNFDNTHKSIHLSYHDGDHYNSVRSITDDTDQPAADIPYILERTQTVQQANSEAWRDSIDYAKILLGEENIEGFLRAKYENPPDIDQLNNDVGGLIDDYYRFDVKEAPAVAKQERKQQTPAIDKTLRPRVLPRNNAKCWCGSNKKYNKCCKSSDMFRDTEPEKVITKLDTLSI